MGVAGRFPFYPSFLFRFLGRHGGTTLLVCGGFQATGAAGSVSGEAMPGRIAAAWATAANPDVPISVVSVASHALSTGLDFANCDTMIDLLKPGLVLIQDFSNHNHSLVPQYRAQVQAVADHALHVGTRPIIYLAYVENSAALGALPVAAAVHDSPDVPLAAGFNQDVAQVTSLVTGPGVPAGTTAKPSPGAWTLHLSHRATIPAGAILHLSLQVTATSGTSVSLAEPAYLTGDNLPVAAPGVPPHTTITLTRHSAAATTSAPVDVPPGTFLQLAHAETASAQSYTAAAQWFISTSAPWASLQLNGWAILGTDPNNPHWLCDGCTTFGPYANDHGNSGIAAVFMPMLQKLTGQAMTAAPAVAAPRP